MSDMTSSGFGRENISPQFAASAGPKAANGPDDHAKFYLDEVYGTPSSALSPVPGDPSIQWTGSTYHDRVSSISIIYDAKDGAIRTANIGPLDATVDSNAVYNGKAGTTLRAMDRNYLNANTIPQDAQGAALVREGLEKLAKALPQIAKDQELSVQDKQDVMQLLNKVTAQIKSMPAPAAAPASGLSGPK